MAVDIFSFGSSFDYVEAAQNGFDAAVFEGVPRLLALTPPKPKAIPRLVDSVELIPESQWTTTTRLEDIGDLLPRYDQGRVGSCEPHSEIECVGGLRAVAGLPPLRLSASFLYALMNRGQDNGASMGDGYDFLRQFGVCTEATCPEGFLTREQLARPMFAEARKIRVLSAYHCRTFAEVVTAHLRGNWVANGVVVAGSFNDLDADGCYPPARGFANHAVSMLDLRRRSNGEWFLWQLNHWTRRWGVDGNFGTSQSAWEAEGYQDAIAYEVVTLDAEAAPPSGLARRTIFA